MPLETYSIEISANIKKFVEAINSANRSMSGFAKSANEKVKDINSAIQDMGKIFKKSAYETTESLSSMKDVLVKVADITGVTSEEFRKIASAITKTKVYSMDLVSAVDRMIKYIKEQGESLGLTRKEQEKLIGALMESREHMVIQSRLLGRWETLNKALYSSILLISKSIIVTGGFVWGIKLTVESMKGLIRQTALVHANTGILYDSLKWLSDALRMSSEQFKALMGVAAGAASQVRALGITMSERGVGWALSYFATGTARVFTNIEKLTLETVKSKDAFLGWGEVVTKGTELTESLGRRLHPLIKRFSDFYVAIYRVIKLKVVPFFQGLIVSGGKLHAIIMVLTKAFKALGIGALGLTGTLGGLSKAMYIALESSHAFHMGVFALIKRFSAFVMAATGVMVALKSLSWGIGKVNETLGRGIEKAERFISIALVGMISAITAVNVVIGTFLERFGKKMLGYIGKAVGAYLHMERAQFRLNTEIEMMSATVKEANEKIDQWNKFIREMAVTTIYSREELTAAIAKVYELGRAVGLTDAQIMEIVKRTLDLSIITGDLHDTVWRVIAAFRGMGSMALVLGLRLRATDVEQTKYVKSLGKTWGQLTTLEKTQAIYLALLEQTDKIQGRATETTNRFYGAVMSLSASFSEMMTIAGQVITEAFKPFVAWLSKMIREVVLATGVMSKLNSFMILVTGIALVLIGKFIKLSMVIAGVVFASKALTYILSEVRIKGMLVGDILTVIAEKLGVAGLRFRTTTDLIKGLLVITKQMIKVGWVVFLTFIGKLIARFVVLIPKILAVGAVLAGLALALVGISKRAKELGIDLGFVSAIVGKFADGLSALSRLIREYVIPIFHAVGDALARWFIAPFFIAGTVALEAVRLVIGAMELLVEFVADRLKDFGDLYLWMSRKAEESWIAKKFAPTLKEIGEGVIYIGEKFGELRKPMGEAGKYFTQMRDWWVDFFTPFYTESGWLLDSIKDIVGSIKSWIGHTSGLTEEQEKLLGELVRLREELKLKNKELRTGEKLYAGYTLAELENMKQKLATTKATEELRRVLGEVIQLIRANRRELRRVEAEKMYKDSIEAIGKAQRDLEDRFGKLRLAMKATDDQGKLSYELSSKLIDIERKHSETIRKLEERSQKLAEQLAKNVGQLREVEFAQFAAEKAVGIYIPALKDLRDMTKELTDIEEEYMKAITGTTESRFKSTIVAVEQRMKEKELEVQMLKLIRRQMDMNGQSKEHIRLVETMIGEMTKQIDTFRMNWEAVRRNLELYGRVEEAVADLERQTELYRYGIVDASRVIDSYNKYQREMNYLLSMGKIEEEEYQLAIAKATATLKDAGIMTESYSAGLLEAMGYSRSFRDMVVAASYDVLVAIRDNIVALAMHPLVKKLGETEMTWKKVLKEMLKSLGLFLVELAIKLAIYKAMIALLGEEMEKVGQKTKKTGEETKWYVTLLEELGTLIAAFGPAIAAAFGGGGGGGGGHSPEITGLQRGAIITTPTLAMIAEEGRPEAVIPLDRGAVPVRMEEPTFAPRVEININAIDTQTGYAFLMRNRGAIVDAIEEARRVTKYYEVRP